MPVVTFMEEREFGIKVPGAGRGGPAGLDRTNNVEQAHWREIPQATRPSEPGPVRL
ncbi:hypothetical protein SALBM311S_10022 [Streptomyces alboniger]